MLSDAVKLIADDMDTDAAETDADGDPVWHSSMVKLLRSYAKQLRNACTAAEGETASTVNNPAAQHRSEIERAKAEFRRGRRVGEMELAEEGVAHLLEPPAGRIIVEDGE